MELEGYWKEVCRTEKEYLNFKVNGNAQLAWKQQLRANYREAQKLFDKKIRFYKRAHKKKDFEDLSNLSNTNPTEMWAKLKRLAEQP